MRLSQKSWMRPDRSTNALHLVAFLERDNIVKSLRIVPERRNPQVPHAEACLSLRLREVMRWQVRECS